MKNLNSIYLLFSQIPIYLLFSLVLILSFILLIITKYFKVNFSGTIFSQVLLSVLMVYMIVSLKEYGLLLLALFILLIIQFKGFLIEGFSEVAELKKEISEENKYLNRENVRKDETIKSLQKELEAASEKVSFAEQKQQEAEREAQYSTANNNSENAQSNSEACRIAQEIIDNRTNYTSDRQQRAEITLNKCMEIKDGFTNYNNNNQLSKMINNYNELNKSNNPIFKNQYHTLNKDKLETENRLIPINTRYFV